MYTQREGHLNTEADTGVTKVQAKNGNQPATRSWRTQGTGFAAGVFEVSGLVYSLISDFLTLEL
jgi:hypothetical protein